MVNTKPDSHQVQTPSAPRSNHQNGLQGFKVAAIVLNAQDIGKIVEQLCSLDRNLSLGPS